MSKSIHIGKEITEFLVNADLRRYKIQKNKLKKKSLWKNDTNLSESIGEIEKWKRKITMREKIAAMAITREEENKTR